MTMISIPGVLPQERPPLKRTATEELELELELEDREKFIEVVVRKKAGLKLDDESASTSGNPLDKGLTLIGTYETNAPLGSTDVEGLFSQKKLYLILDLDLTLLHTTMLKSLTPDEEYLKSQSDSLEDVSKGSLFIWEDMGVMTKLRPFVRTFLREASKMFEMYINTKGNRLYAQQMAKLLDPREEYFSSSRIISRDDYGTKNHQKSLGVLQGREPAVMILDDTPEVWNQHKDNLIVIKRYNYFAPSSQTLWDSRSFSLLKSDEREFDGALACVLKVLKQIHHMFFKELDCSSSSRDTRQLLRSISKEKTESLGIVQEHAPFLPT